MNSLRSIFKQPIVLLITVNILIGLFTFRTYGLSWDEPLFYSYADSLGYAYSPHEWFSGNFDLENSYGASGEDHKTRGPAYLFLARNFVYGLNALGSDSASAWHLVNFLFSQLGVYLLYRFARRWLSPQASFATSAFFCYQPLLWGHFFINPKDPPFLTFFLAAVCFGFEMVDELLASNPSKRTIFLAAFSLGIATSIRVLGPLAGVIVLLYMSLQATAGRVAAHDLRAAYRDQRLRTLASYITLSLLTMLLTWPYLWENPVTRLFETLRFMSDNPTQLAVLFNGQVFRADDMPRRYFPFMLGTTLTEPTWFLFLIGTVIGIIKLAKTNRPQLISFLLTLSWFFLLLGYVILRQPAIYDGIRHFLFVLPPIFITIGFCFEAILSVGQTSSLPSKEDDTSSVEKASSLPSTNDKPSTKNAFSSTSINSKSTNIGNKTPIWLRAVLLIAILLPGIRGILTLHPYEYTYYNSFLGGTSGVFRQYETDYWLTCYKEAIHKLDSQLTEPANLFIHREAQLALFYSTPNITIHELRGAGQEVQSGDYVLITTRTNLDRSIYNEVPPIIQVRRGASIFCEIKRIP